MAVFEGQNLSIDVIINDKLSDDEVVASDVPPRYLFLNNPLYGMEEITYGNP